MCVAALSCVATMCCGAARVRAVGEKTAGPSTLLRSAQDERSVGGRRAAKKAVALTPWEQAERGRETLEAISEATRTRADYTLAMDAYRAIYHANPADVHAAAAVNAVAELLVEQGRTLHDEKSLRAAVGQYEFLRTQYPASSLGVQALLAEGQIAQNDLKDAATARERYKLLLKEHGRSEQAEEARAGLASLEVQGSRFEVQGKTTGPKASADQPSHSTQPAKLEGSANRDSSATNGAYGSVRPQGLKPSSTGTSDGTAKAVPLTKQSGHGVQVSSLPAMAQTSGVGANGAAQQRLGTSQLTHPTPPAKMAGTPVRDTTAMRGADSVAGAMAGGEARSGKPALVTGIRHWSTATYTRVAIDLGDNVTYEAARVPNPDRIYFDLHGARLAPELVGKSFAVTDDGFLKKVRAAQYSDDVTRVVLDVNDVTEYSAFLLPNPYRLIIDIHGGKEAGNRDQATGNKDDMAGLAVGDVPAPRAAVTVKPTTARPVPNSVATKSANAASEVAGLSQLPGRVEATSKPTSKPISAVVETGNRDQGTVTPASHDRSPGTPTGNRNGDGAGSSAAGMNAAVVTPADAASGAPASSLSKTRRSRARTAGGSTTAVADATPARAAVPTADGETSLVRALGLKIGRIVIDPGHGGHDSGTLGVDGIEEKDVVLDVALRLGKLLHDRLGAEIIYTRSDDTFIPLETRTAIANKAQADLFLSIHANSSPEASARGVETYYLNFTSDPTALDVAARENAVSDQSIHQLSDLVKKIALKDKIAESREFAGDVEGSLYAGLQKGNAGLKDRGVKKAPFVVLIGANMPSILAEISFVTNPKDAEQLRDPEYRERVAESLYKGIASYQGGLSGAHVATERAAVGQ
jgi:N-acetylmuramoyl-L-alanine amidase